MSKFKIGDRVRAIHTSSGGGVQVGDVFVVTKIDGDYVGFFNPREGLSDGWLSHHFELALTLETGTFYRTRSGKPTGRVTVGDTGFEAIVDGRVRIYDAAGGHVHGSAELDIVEAWAPKVGERVRFVRDNPNGGRVFGAAGDVVEIAGEVHASTVYGHQVEIAHPGFSWKPAAPIAALEPLPVAPQPAAPVLVIEAGRHYKTRDGRKVGPLRDKDDFNNHYPFRAIGGPAGTLYYTASGTCNLGWSQSGSEDFDIIAEWQETTNVGAQVDTLAEEYGPIVLRNVKLHLNDNEPAAKPKFKVGDRVKCIDNRGAPTDFKVGEFYTVTAVEDDMVRCGDAGMFGYRFELAPAPWSGYGKTTSKFKAGDRVRVMKDGNGIGGSRHYAKIGDDFLLKGMNETRTFWRTNGPDFYEHEISLATTQPTAIVALIEDGKPKPADIPHVHANQAAAEREAKRLAGVHKGKQFGVYVLATTAEEPAPVYAHEWQRLAADGRRPLAVSSLVRTAGIPQGHAERIVGLFAA
jgi:hypothetical protein